MDAMKEALKRKMAAMKEHHDHAMSGDGVAEHMIEPEGDAESLDDEAKESLQEKMAEKQAGTAAEYNQEDHNPEMAPERQSPDDGGMHHALKAVTRGAPGGSPFAQKVHAHAKSQLAAMGKGKGKY